MPDFLEEFTPSMKYLYSNLKCWCDEPGRRLRYFNEGKKVGQARFWALLMAQVGSTLGQGNLAARGKLHVECPSCGAFPVWSSGDVHGEWTCICVEDTARSAELVGDDSRRVTNRLSTESPRSFRFKQQWTSALTLEESQSSSSVIDSKVANFEQRITSSIQSRRCLDRRIPRCRGGV